MFHPDLDTTESFVISVFQLMESGIQNKLVAELFLPIPEPSHMSGRVELECFEFSSDQQVFYKHEGVGSGRFFVTQAKLSVFCVLYKSV